MQPGTNSAEDLHSILNRFQTWSGKHAGPESGNGHKPSEGVREIPYEEALRMVRSHRAARGPRPAVAVAAKPPEAQKGALIPDAATGAALPCPAAVAGDTPAPAAGENAVASAVAMTTNATTPGKTGEKQVQKRAVMRMAAAKSAKPMANSPRQAAGKSPEKAKSPRIGSRQQSRVGVAAKNARAGKSLEFSEVLAESMQKRPATVRSRSTKEPERAQRISVRLSQTEERRLQECAQRAGMTVSAYLRERVLAGTIADSEASDTKRSTVTPLNSAATLAAAQQSRSNSVLGEWIALLRNRFLSSPVRFAERA